MVDGSRKVGKTIRKAPQNFTDVQRHHLNNQGLPAYWVRNKENFASSCVLSLRFEKETERKVKSTNAPYFPSHAGCFYEKEKRTKPGKLPKTTIFRKSGSTG